MPSSIQYSVGVKTGLGTGYKSVALGAHDDYPRATSPAALHVHRLELGLLELRFGNLVTAAEVSVILSRDAAGLRPITAVGATGASQTIATVPAIDGESAVTTKGSAVFQLGVEPPVVLEANDALYLLIKVDAGSADVVAALSWGID